MHKCEIPLCSVFSCVQNLNIVKTVLAMFMLQAATSKKPRMTVAQPFHFSEKHKEAPPAPKFVSMAETLTAFHRKTPERFRARARSKFDTSDSIAHD